MGETTSFPLSLEAVEKEGIDRNVSYIIRCYGTYQLVSILEIIWIDTLQKYWSD